MIALPANPPSLAMSSVHGMPSRSASMDLGGKRKAGGAVGSPVGIGDGFIYMGTTLEAFSIGRSLPGEDQCRADGQSGVSNPENRWTGPAAVISIAMIGFLLATGSWCARLEPMVKAVG